MINYFIVNDDDVTSFFYKRKFSVGLINHLCIQTEDEVLIDNEQAKEELHDFEKFRDQLTNKPKAFTEEQTANPPLQISEADLPSKASNRDAKSKGKKRYRGK